MTNTISKKISFILMLLFFHFNSGAQTYKGEFGNTDLAGPLGTTIDINGNIYVGDVVNHRILKYNSNKVLQTTYNYLGGIGAMSADAAGNVYVADFGAGYNRVWKINAAGGISQFVNGLSGPRGVAIHPVSGNIYITEAEGSKISIYTPSGGFVSSIPISGYPTDLAFDAVGNFYVVNQSQNKVLKFNSSGVLQSAVATGLNNPWSVIVDANGNIWVTDSGNNRIVQYNNNLGAPINSFGTPGSAAGKFSYPDAIEIDPATNDIYVVDYGNHRVQIFATACNGTYTYGASYPSPGADGIYQGSNGLFYVNNNIGSHTSLSSVIRIYNSSFAANGGPLGPFTDSQGGGLVLDPSLNIYVAQTGASALRKYNQAGTLIASAPVNGPRGVAIGPDGFIYVAEQYSNRIIKFNQSLQILTTFGTNLVNGGVTFSAPFGVAIDAANNLFVSTSDGYIWKFKKDGTLLKKFGGSGTFSKPEGLAIDKGGNLFVADRYHYRIVKCNNNGDFITSLAPPSGNHLMGYVYVDNNCNVYASEYGNIDSLTGVIHKFNFNTAPKVLRNGEEEIATTDQFDIIPAMKASPNPNNGNFKVHFKNGGVHNIRLINNVGTEVKKEIAEGSEYSFTDESLTEGLYILQSEQEGFEENLKIVIQK